MQQVMESTRTRDYAIGGLRVRSWIGLPWRPALAGDEPDVEIRLGVVDPLDGPPGGNGARFGVAGGSIVLSVGGVGRFAANGGREVVVDAEPGASAEDLQLYVTGAMLGAIWQQRGSFPLHASALAVGSDAVAFAGRTGAGKSTLAAFLARRGYPLITDDMCVLTDRDDGRVAVWPGPSRIKLGRDGLSVLHEDVTALRPAGGTRDKYQLPVPAARNREGPIPLRLMYLLAAGEGEPRVERLSGLDAIDVVAGHTYSPEFARALHVESAWLASCVGVSRAIGVRRLVRPLGFRHMDVVLDVLEEDWRTL